MKNLFTLFVSLLVVVNLNSQSYPPFFNVLSPQIIRASYAPGEYGTVTTGWGWDGTISANIIGELVYAPEEDTGLHTLCDDATNIDYTDKIVLVDRGLCEFGVKALIAQNLGALAVVIINFDDSPLGLGTGSVGAQVTIPTILITQSAGDAILSQLTNNIPVTVAFSIGPIDVSTVIGNIRYDENEDCIDDPNELGLGGWKVLLTENGNLVNLTYSHADGYYFLFGDIGTYDVTLIPPNPMWSTCSNTQQVTFTEYDTMAVDFAGQKLYDCPFMTVDIETPFLRRCFDTNIYKVEFCNTGTATATAAYLEVGFDPLLNVVSATIPYTLLAGNVLHFELGDVVIGECGSFQIQVEVSCDAILGQTLCTEAYIFPDTLCIPAAANWSGSNIFIEGVCNGNEVQFTIENKGSGDMVSAADYRVLKNAALLESGTYQLAASATQSFAYEADGGTYRLEAKQAIDFPLPTNPSRTMEGCNSNNSGFFTGFFNMFSAADFGTTQDEECVEVIGSYDPNDKQGFPFGYGENHYIERNIDLQYLIRFQNTGTDTAFTVVVLDTLTDLLDLSTLRLGPASHDFVFEIVDGHVLEFRFDDILLPDSNINEAASHGFLTFTISQKNNLPLESVINNSAAIYFDFNAPVITNVTVHTVGENFLPVATQHRYSPEISMEVFPNPMSESAVFDLGETAFQKGELHLFDLQGKQVRNVFFDQPKFVVKRNGLPNGAYFYLVKLDGKDAVGGKLLVGR